MRFAPRQPRPPGSQVVRIRISGDLALTRRQPLEGGVRSSGGRMRLATHITG
jgi:hypothetical protein